MARIFCGVMGDAGGHVSQARTLAAAMPEHEFLFAGGGQAAGLADTGHPVATLPVAATHRGRRVRLAATALSGTRVLAAAGPTLRSLSGLIREFDPHLILSFYEFFTALAARRLGRPCLGIDHQHALTLCRPPILDGALAARLMFMAPLRLMYGHCTRYLVHSFFAAPTRDPHRAETFPPLLSPELLSLRPTAGEHVLAYLNPPTFAALGPALSALGRPVLVYGLGRRASRGNLSFRAPSRQGFLSDLAACLYLVANGGHTAISEALHLGKPVLSFPISWDYEQYANARVLGLLGYGGYCLQREPGPEVFRTFEAGLEAFRQRIAGNDFHGTERLTGRIRQILAEG